MWPVTDAFREALTRSHTLAYKIEILETTADGLDSVLATLTEVTVSGTINVEKRAAVRRRAKLKIVDVSGALVPADASDLLSPYGNEIRIWRGISAQDLDASEDELVPLATLQISDVEIDDSGGITIDVEGFDRSQAVADARFTEPYVIASGTNLATAIQAGIQSRIALADSRFNFASTSYTTPATVFTEQKNPWESFTKLAEAAGMELFFNPMGDAMLRAEPSLDAGAVVWTYAEGAEATLLKVNKKMTRRHIYNGVIATGEGPDNSAPVRAEAWDTDPSSPTYYLSPKFGRKPRWFSSPLMTTTDQCSDAASSMLRKSLGLSQELRFDAIVNPAHEEGDVVRLVRDDIGLDEIHLIDAFDLGLAPSDVLQARTRSQVIVE